MSAVERDKSYIICATTRSGSTLLCGLLRDSGVAGNPESYFHVPSVAAWGRSLDLPAQDVDDDPLVLRRIFEAAQEKGRGGTRVFGLRLMRKSFGYFMSRLNVLFPDLPSDLARIEAAFGPTRFIHLTRADKVAQAVSLIKATQTGLWHVAPDGTEMERQAPHAPPTYNADLIGGTVAELTAFDLAWTRWFDREGLHPLRVEYQDLARNPALALSQVLDHLGIKAKGAQKCAPAVAKLADDVSQEWIERFRQEAR